jgi:rod shape-determining protein MreC
VGTVASVAPGQDLFLNVRVRPAAPINRLEEVLVITKMDERAPDAVATQNPVRAIDVLAERLPTVAPPAPKPEGGEATTGKPAATGTMTGTPKTAGQSATDKKNTPVELKPAPKKTDTAASTSSGQPQAVKQAETTPGTKPQEPKKDKPHP